MAIHPLEVPRMEGHVAVREEERRVGLAALVDVDGPDVGAVDARGDVAVHTGEHCIPEAGHVAGEHWTCQANMMGRATVPDAMSAAFARAEGDLAERLMTALEGAEAEGGDVRGRQSAALLVVPREGEAWQFTADLRVEDHKDPVGELRRLVLLHRAYALAGQADELMGEGRFDEAAPMYVRAAELAPESDELLFWAGLGIAQNGDIDAGVDAVRRAASVHPGWLTLLDRLSPEFAPAGAAVRAALGGGTNSSE
jgi:hypothetical protein